MMGIDNIKKSALSLGACGKIERVDSIKSAVNLLMSPQGREFALKTGFPTLDEWRENAREATALSDVLLDKGVCSVVNCDCLVIGDTEAMVRMSGVGQLYHVMVMHGAKVTLNASDYAVVTLTCVNATCEIENDGTAVIMVEQS